MSTHRLSPRILGQAERAHRALLEHLLQGTGLTSQHWVALTLASATDHVLEPEAIRDLAGALKIERTAATVVIAELNATGLLETRIGELHISEEGSAVYRRIRVRVDEVIADLYRDIPTMDLDIAGRVLAELTMRASKTLEALELGSAAGHSAADARRVASVPAA